MRLYDVKRIYMCPTRYKTRQILSQDPPAERRARQVNQEATRKAKQLDTKYNGIQAGQDGPFQRELRRRGPIIGLAVGHYGEVSNDVDTLMRDFARGIAQRNYVSMGAKSARGAYSACLMQTRDQLGVEIARHTAWLVLDRVQYLYTGSAVARERRQRSNNRYHAEQATYQGLAERHGRAYFGS